MNDPIDEIFDISKILRYEDQGWDTKNSLRSRRLLDSMSLKQREILNGPESGYCVKIGYGCSGKVCDVIDCYCICQSTKLLNHRISRWNAMTSLQLENRVIYKRRLLELKED